MSPSTHFLNRSSSTPNATTLDRKELAPWGHGGSAPKTIESDVVRAVRGHTSPWLEPPWSSLLLLLPLSVARLEACHPAAGVDDLLLARVERVAVGADLDVDA